MYGCPPVLGLKGGFPHPGSLGRILSQIRFGSTLNIAASLASPAQPQVALRGVYSPDKLESVGCVMRNIGYRRGLVVHGFEGNDQPAIDEMSNVGKTLMYEFFADGTVASSSLLPEDVGVRRADVGEIEALGYLEAESIRFIRVLADNGHDACGDLAVLNAGALFYVAGLSDNIGSGVITARELVGSGAAMRKLAEWVEVQNTDLGKGRQRLQGVMRKAGVLT
jgi:anthranilate phosphoribosyltransferase